MTAPTVTPTDARALADALAGAAAERAVVLPRGAGTRPGPAATPEHVDQIIATTGLRNLLDCSPDDLVVKVSTGVPLAELHGHLAEHQRSLPLQRRAAAGTVGGLVATGAEGATALAHGPVRDHVIGATVACADGRLAEARGRVAKNVAGYDLPRMHTGALGTLGILVDVTFKLLPAPERELTLLASFSPAARATALELAADLLARPWEPVFVDLLIDVEAVHLLVGFDGRAARVDKLSDAAQRVMEASRPDSLDVLSGTRAEDWRALLDDPVAHLVDQPGAAAVVRLTALPSAIAALAERARDAALLAGVTPRLLLRPGLGSATLALPSPEPTVRARARAAVCAAGRRDAHAVVLDPAGQLLDADDVWGPPPTDFVLMRRLRDALDPERVLVAGRHVGGL